MTGQPAGGRQRRGAAVEQTVLAATLALLAERGYEFTVDDVAARAQVHKTTVYRRWETKPVLVAAALRTVAERDVATPKVDDPLVALEQLAVLVARALRRPEGANALRAAFSAAGADSELRETSAHFLAARYTGAVDLIRAAQLSGALRPGLDPVLVWQAIVNPLHVDAVLSGDVSDERARALVDIVLTGARTPCHD